LAILVIPHSCDADIADRSLELDERVGLVVSVGWASLTIGTEVGVIADSTLVSITLDVGWRSIVAVAKRSIAVDTVVTSLASAISGDCGSIKKSLVDGDESMLRMNETGIGDTG